MKKSVKRTKTKFFNEAIREEDLIAPSIITPSREDIILTCSRCSTDIDDNIYKLKPWYNNDVFFVCENCYNELTSPIYKRPSRRKGGK